MSLDLRADLRECGRVKWGSGLIVLLVGLTLAGGAFAIRYVLEREDVIGPSSGETATGLTGAYRRYFDPAPHLYGDARLEPSWCSDIEAIDLHTGDGTFLGSAVVARPRVETGEFSSYCEVSFATEIPRSSLVSVAGVTYTWQELQTRDFHVELEETVHPCDGWVLCDS